GGAEMMNVGQVDGALTYDGDCLARTIDSGGVKSLQIVDGGEVIRYQKMIAGDAGSETRLHAHRHFRANVHSRLGLEVMQMLHSDRHPRKHSWHGRLRGVGKVHFAIHEVAMNLGAERGLNLRDRPL